MTRHDEDAIAIAAQSAHPLGALSTDTCRLSLDGVQSSHGRRWSIQGISGASTLLYRKCGRLNASLIPFLLAIQVLRSPLVAPLLLSRIGWTLDHLRPRLDPPCPLSA